MKLASSSNYNKYEDLLVKEKWRNGFNEANLFEDWRRAKRRRQAEAERQAQRAQRRRELEAERDKLALLEREEKEAGLLLALFSDYLTLPLATLGVLGVAVLASFGLAATLLAFALLLAALGGQVRRAKRRVRAVQARSRQRQREWERVVGTSLEFGPRLPVIGFQITVPDRREVVDEEAGTVCVDFCRRELEWRATGWHERRFTVQARVLAEDEAELASRWFDFCAELAQAARLVGDRYRGVREAEERARVERELKQARIELSLGAASRLQLPRPETDYLP